MKKITLVALSLSGILAIGALASGNGADEDMNKQGMMHSSMMQNGMNHMRKMEANDNRMSLNIPPQMKAEQLKNMREHLEAIKKIVDLLQKGDFDKASEVAHSKLGLVKEMKQMCSMFDDNKGFKEMGFAFHKSADKLGETLKSKDMKKSLQALSNTMSFCVQCHATYKQ